jgi:alpha-D-ribose 1-methylphosphonate 5-triphosphate diphosphatase
MKMLENGKIITPSGILADHVVVIGDDRILSVEPKGLRTVRACDAVHDVGGAYILPGFIDIHADYIEHMAAPRPSSIMNFSLALHEAERELITHGITTMFHSLSMYKNADFGSNPVRSAENTEKLMELIHNSHESAHLIRHRFHARFEIDNVQRVDELETYLKEKKIHLVSFMDHSPGQGQYRSLEIFKKTLKGYRNLSDEECDRIINEGQNREKLTIDVIAGIAEKACANGIAIASHDDDTIEKIALVRGFLATISEFPITLEVAREARRQGMHTVAGAPNILLGGSHSGNLNAAEAILDGSIDILCSDYYPAALLHAVFHMHRIKGMPLHDMVNMVTLNAAKAVGMDKEIGSVEQGKKADLLIVEELEDGFPAVTGAYVDGRCVFQTSYRNRQDRGECAEERERGGDDRKRPTAAGVLATVGGYA